MAKIDGIITPSRSIDVLDKVVEILQIEIDNQRALSITLGDTAYQEMLDSFYLADGTTLSLWKNRATPHDLQELNAIDVNFGTVQEDTGSPRKIQKATSSINIDVAIGNDVDSDEKAALYLEWIASTIRGIIQYGDYVRLDTDYVGHRWISQISQYEVPEDNTSYLIVGRMTLEVKYDEPNLLKTGLVPIEGNDTKIKADKNAEYSNKTNF